MVAAYLSYITSTLSNNFIFVYLISSSVSRSFCVNVDDMTVLPDIIHHCFILTDRERFCVAQVLHESIILHDTVGRFWHSDVY